MSRATDYAARTKHREISSPMHLKTAAKAAKTVVRLTRQEKALAKKRAAERQEMLDRAAATAKGGKKKGKKPRSSSKKVMMGKGRRRGKSNEKITAKNAETSKTGAKAGNARGSAVGVASAPAWGNGETHDTVAAKPGDTAKNMADASTASEDTKSEELKGAEESPSERSAVSPAATKEMSNTGTAVENNTDQKNKEKVEAEAEVEAEVEADEEADEEEEEEEGEEEEEEEEEMSLPDDYWTASLTLEDGSKITPDDTLNKWDEMRARKNSGGREKKVEQIGVSDDDNTTAENKKAEEDKTVTKSFTVTKSSSKKKHLHKIAKKTDEMTSADSSERSDEKSNDQPAKVVPKTFALSSLKKSDRLSRKRSLLAMRNIRKQSVAQHRTASKPRQNGRTHTLTTTPPSGHTLAKARAAPSTASFGGLPTRPRSRAPGPTNLESDHYRLGMEATQLPRRNSLSPSNATRKVPVKRKEEAAEEATLMPVADSEITLQAAADLRVSIAWSVRKAKQIQRDIFDQQRQLDSVLNFLVKQQRVSELLTDIVSKRSNPMMMLDLRNLVKDLHHQQQQLGAALPDGDAGPPPVLPPRK